MQTSTSPSTLAPRWSAEALTAAVPHALPPLHRFVFVPPANAADLHRPHHRTAPYVARHAAPLFRVRG